MGARLIPSPITTTLGTMGRPTGLEPATSGTTNRRSNQLSYGRHKPSTAACAPIGAAEAARQGMARDIDEKDVVGATGIEPVTPPV